MPKKAKSKLKYKIILICTICTLFVGVVSNLLLYRYLNNIIMEKMDTVETMNFSAINQQLSSTIENLSFLGYQCSNDLSVASILDLPYTPITLAQKKKALTAKETLQTYLNAHEVQEYVEHLVAFNQYGTNLQPVAKGSGSIKDPEKIMALPLFQEFERMRQEIDVRQIIGLSKSIENDKECMALISPVYNYTTSKYDGWVYIELNLQWVSEILLPYTNGSYYLTSDDYIYQQNPIQQNNFQNLPLPDSESFVSGDTVHVNGQVMKLYSSGLDIKTTNTYIPHFILYHLIDITQLADNGNTIAYTTIVVMVSCLLIAVILAFLLSGAITTPLHRLTARLRKISENDFSFDPEIEKGNDEIAEMGVVVNEMSTSISHLLKETEEMYKNRQDIEIALLQSQINPHFLYNTLDSIRWMATIQKNPGIVTMTRSLSNLLRNIAKGVGDKIPLSQEIELLKDYTEIQSIRYVETFTFEDLVSEELQNYKIVKFTLQPLVENAIFHGIEPTGRYGTVQINATIEGDDLLLTVYDNGAGMTPEKLNSILENKSAQSHANSLSGIGVLNVDKRLKLQYGKNYGLSYESILGEYTKVTIRIPKEE